MKRYTVGCVDGVWKVWLIDSDGRKYIFVNDACSFEVADAIATIFTDLVGR